MTLLGIRRCGARCSLGLGLLCVVLVVLAAAERRLGETDWNRADLVAFKNGETGKVINLLAEIDRVPEPRLEGLGPAVVSDVPAPRNSIVLRLFAGHSDSRAPPR